MVFSVLKSVKHDNVSIVLRRLYAYPHNIIIKIDDSTKSSSNKYFYVKSNRNFDTMVDIYVKCITLGTNT